MNTVPYKGEDWPVSDDWAEKNLAGAFAELVTWETGSQHEDDGVGLWGRLWAILRKSDETVAQRTQGMTHAQIGERMLEDPEFFRSIVEAITPWERRELRAVEAHLIVRRRVDNLLGRDLSEFTQYINHAHGQGWGAPCGCELLLVMDDIKLERAQSAAVLLHEHREGLKELSEEELASAEAEAALQFMFPHYPRRLCDRHMHLKYVVTAARGDNRTLADRLYHVHEVVKEYNLKASEAQADEAAAA